MSRQIPEGWINTELGAFVSIQGGYAFKSEDFCSSGVSIVRISNINKNGSIDLSDSVFSRYDSALKRYELSKGDALIAMSGATTGKVGKYKSNNLAYLNQRVGRFKIKDDSRVENDFIYQVASTDHFINSILIDAAGGAQPNISSQQIEAFSILLPPLPEQQKIATILTSVDTVIEKTRAQIDKLKHLKTGMMQELLTQGIGHTEFKDTPVGRIPKIWNIYTAQELLNSKTLLKLQDGNHGSQYPRALDFVSSGVPYIAASHISETGEINFNNCPHLSQKHANELRIRPAMGGDVILTHNATVGRTAIIPDDRNEVIASTSTTYYRTNNAKLLNRYLYYYFQSTSYISQLLSIMGQTTRNQVPITTQRELLIIIPPIQEQIILADTIEVVAHNIKAKCEKLDSLILLKKALMQDLLTGNKRTHAF